MRGLIVGLCLVVASNLYANTGSSFLDKSKFSQLNLSGFRLVDQESNLNAFDYLVRKVSMPTSELIANLESESDSKVVSPVYELNERSAFKNIYVYVGQKSDGSYEFCTLYVNGSGSSYLVDMDIVDATANELFLTQESAKYRVLTGRPLFGP